MGKGLQKGQTNNPNGRPKGVANKITKELRNLLKSIIAKELETLPEQLESLPAKDRIELIVKLMAYVLPKIDTVVPQWGESSNYDFIDNF
jgi:23S rRNA C2498 (ribose-2'-O)-methylase RlmM